MSQGAGIDQGKVVPRTMALDEGDTHCRRI
jgi:hypothetical protein